MDFQLLRVVVADGLLQKMLKQCLGLILVVGTIATQVPWLLGSLALVLQPDRTNCIGPPPALAQHQSTMPSNQPGIHVYDRTVLMTQLVDTGYPLPKHLGYEVRGTQLGVGWMGVVPDTINPMPQTGKQVMVCTPILLANKGSKLGESACTMGTLRSLLICWHPKHQTMGPVRVVPFAPSPSQLQGRLLTAGL